MTSLVSVGIILAVAVCIVFAIPEKTLVGCLKEDMEGPVFSEAAVGHDNTSTPTECSTACLENGYIYAAVSEGIHCFCTADIVAANNLVAGPLGTECELVCDTEACGSEVDTTYLSVYDTGGGSPYFTLAAATDDDTKIDLEITSQNATGTTFLVDYGNGAPPSYFNDTTAMMNVPTFVVPGEYGVTVTGIIEGTPLTYAETVSITKTAGGAGGASTVDAIDCPIVFEPELPYYCNVTATPIDDTTEFTGEFDDDPGVTITILSGSDIYRLGNAVPRGLTSQVLPPGPATDLVMLVDHPVTVAAMVMAYDIYGYESGAYTVMMKRPTCSSGSYCVHERGCMAQCPHDLHTNQHTCAAPQIFCPYRRTCTDTISATTCQAPEAAPATWEDVAGTEAVGSFGGPGFTQQKLTAPTEVLPGDVIAVKGPVGIWKTTLAGGDEVNGVKGTAHYFVSAFLKENVPVQVEHICTTVDTDVILTVSDAAVPSVTLSNHTSCERNITDINMKVNQQVTDDFDATLNTEEPFYVRTITPITYTAMFSVAGPTTFTYTYEPEKSTGNDSITDPTDYPLVDGPHEVTHEVTIPDEGVYQVTICVENQHNVIPGPVCYTTTVLAQHEVVTTWTVTPDSPVSDSVTSHNAFLITSGGSEEAKFKFEDTAAANFPTNATAECDWGDGEPKEMLGFVNPGDNMPILAHRYKVGGVYEMVAYIFNKVSGYTVKCKVLIVESVTDFAIANKYFPSDLSDPIPGYGPQEIQFPRDKNLTFYPSMTFGTVDTYEIKFTANGSLIASFPVTDRFSPLEDYLFYHFDLEDFLNLTVYAINTFEQKPVDLFVEIIEQVRLAKIDDYKIVTSAGQMKTFEITFESIGSGTCLVVDFNDATPIVLHSYGEEYSCTTTFGHATYHPEVTLTLNNSLKHTYDKEGTYNISILAYNPVSSVQDMLMFCVSSLQCRPPEVEIFDGTLDYLTAPRFYKGEDVPLLSVATLDCPISSKTKKRWQIFDVDYLWGHILSPRLTMDILKTWNMSELVIPATFLPHGRYCLTYTLSMVLDDSVDQMCSFETKVETFIEIIPSPLKPSMFGGVSQFTIGLIQEMLMDPIAHSVDPDFPEQKNFSVEWRCKQEDESWPATDDTYNPIFKKGTSGTGCFGYGPGMLDYYGTNLTLLGSDFVAVDKVYEIQAILTKDERNATASGGLKVVTDVVPILAVRCLMPSLCEPDGDGVYVNPSLKLGIIVECVDYCNEPYTYKWTVMHSDESVITPAAGQEIVGNTINEYALDPAFYKDYESESVLKVKVEATDAAGAMGSAMYRLKINKPPIDGSCRVIEAPNRLSLVEKYGIECSGWTDPENKGVSYYSIATIDETGTKTQLVDMKYTSIQPNSVEVILPPGVFDVEIQVYDKWGAFTEITAITGMEVLMPSKEQIDAADLDALIAQLSGAGDSALLTQVIAARTKVNQEADWLSLDPDALKGLTPEEIQERIKNLADMNNAALDAIKENTVYNSVGSISGAASAVAGMLKASIMGLESYKTMDLDARDKVADISEDIMNGLLETDPPSSDLLVPLVNYMGVIAGGMAETQNKVGGDETCQSIPPTDFDKRDRLPYDTRIPSEDYVKPEVPEDIYKCNIREITKERAKRISPLIEKVLDRITESTLGKMLNGETYNLSTETDIHVNIGITNRLSTIPVGTNGTLFTFPDDYCPQGSCSEPIAYSIREWPFVVHGYAKYSDLLALGTKNVELRLYSRGIDPLVVRDLPKGKEIKINLPRTLNPDDNNTLPEYKEINAIKESASQKQPIVYSTFNITKIHSAVTLEIIPETFNPRLFVMVSKPRMPLVRRHESYFLLKDTSIKHGAYNLFLASDKLGGKGRYFVGIGEFKKGFDTSLMKDPVKNNVTRHVAQNITTNFKMRVITCGCYYFNRINSAWQGDGLRAYGANRQMTFCSANHLTSFAAGMFVMPNTIDFNYVFANMGFTDNLTIYLTIIISLAIFLLLLIYARYKDKQDVQKLGATPLPDNKVEDKYFYEMLVFTGDVRMAQTDSLVQFTVAGDYDETDVRTLADSRRKILRKGTVDVFVMAVPRPLGSLQFLHIWHDNSGKGPNASWFLGYIVFRDVQSGDKYEFICHQWLAVEHHDGQIERVLQVAGLEQRVQFSHLYNTTKDKNMADGHLWLSIFLRPPRSRFTRCQRVASCFALLFLSMLVNAMWYDRVPEQPGTGGLNLGPFHLSPEQIGVGVMSNLIVFPPSFLIVFLFRKSQPRVLRKSRIEMAYQRTKAEKGAKESDNCEEEENEEVELDENGERIMYKKVIEKKEKNKKFVLPFWVKYLAWLLVGVCIGASCFFLLMYGIMFGNSKATKWVTSLVISFFSSILFVQPLKIFLTAILVSLICKSVDLDEDDADEDEEEPNLEQDEIWLHPGDKTEKHYKAKKVDNELLRKLGERRKKEVEMHSILKEIFFYAFFLWILLILSYGNRDPNAFYLQKTLKEGFIHEGAIDDTDFNLVNNADRLWKYLYSGFLTDLRADWMYNGKPPYGLRGFFNDWANRVMGYAIIRQIRTKNNTCRVPYAVNALDATCSGFTTIVNEDSKHYCQGWVLPTNKTSYTLECNIPEFRYETAEQLESFPIWGMRDWYSGGGYVIHLRDSTTELLRKFKELQSHSWIDSRTRAVLIEFSSYNSQVNLFGLSTIMAEFTPGGGVYPSYRFEGIRLLNHHDNFGAFIIACEVGFCLFVIYYTITEVKLFYKQRMRYFDSYWSYAEIAILIASYTGIALYWMRYFATARALTIFKETKGNGYIRMQYAANLNEAFSYIVAFIVFVGTIKFAKLLRFNKRIGVLSATLHQCWDDLSGFLMAFFLCFCSFVMLFYMLLNMFLEDFHNFIVSIETCFSMMLGKFQFEEMKEASMMVPIMFFIFVLCNSWVLVNLLLTLVIKSFQQVKHDIMKQPNEYEMVAFIWDRFKAFIGQTPMVQTGPLTTVEKTKPDGEDCDKVNELPNKVDKFLDYMNQVYFAGTLDVSNRDALKSSLYRNQKSGRKSYSGANRGSSRYLGSGVNKWHGQLND